ncbi:substrate-binding domain-containing protein [Occultella kanbiaonis]|uniref:substrate-binding domain-containing protein n=1 Tax=Occultella kanbiaonis TaxID=2675754 RepID=UPI00143D9F6E|nr:substrate-binding domain-containing protein [Occultella kanbiaonis]
MSVDGHGQLARERQERFLRLLRAKGSVAVGALAAEFDVSEMTVRRDLNALAARGLAVRVHGGATVPDAPGPDAAASPSDPRDAHYLTIGLVLPGAEYYWSPVIAGARAAAARANVRLILRITSYEAREDRHQVQALLASARVDGLIIAPNLDREGGGDLVTWLDALPIPVVLVERRPPGVPVRRLEWVATDHAAGGVLAVQHLLAHGHRRIAVCTGPTATTEDLIQGWQSELRTRGLDAAEQFAMRVDLTERGRQEAAAELLDRCAETGTTAVIVHPDVLTITVVQRCLDLGISIPEDLAIVSYDDEVAALIDPPVSSVMPLKQDVGRMAVELIHARLLEGDRRPPHRLTVMPVLNVRGSSSRR